MLRGGFAPNYDAASVAGAVDRLVHAGLPAAVMVDCSHGNSGRDALRQIEVAHSIANQRNTQPALRAIMLESHLVAGRQDIGAALTYGQSITDACLGFAQTEQLLAELAEPAEFAG